MYTLKKVQVLYEHYKMLLSQRREHNCSWIERPNILKMSILQGDSQIKYNSSQHPSEVFF